MKIQNLEARVPSPIATHPRLSAKPAEDAGPSPFSRVLHKLGRDVDAGERTVSSALAGGSSHDPAALLALQAGVYKYVEAVDLASKLVDRATSAVKTVLTGQ